MVSAKTGNDTRRITQLKQNIYHNQGKPKIIYTNIEYNKQFQASLKPNSGLTSRSYNLDNNTRIESTINKKAPQQQIYKYSSTSRQDYNFSYNFYTIYRV